MGTPLDIHFTHPKETKNVEYSKETGEMKPRVS
jgi:hypothetical protein